MKPCGEFDISKFEINPEGGDPMRNVEDDFEIRISNFELGYSLVQSATAGMLSANDLYWWTEEPLISRTEYLHDTAKAA